MNRKPLTEEEYNNLNKRMRYYYRKNRPELLINVKNLFKLDGRKKKYFTEQERYEAKRNSDKVYREKIRTIPLQTPTHEITKEIPQPRDNCPTKNEWINLNKQLKNLTFSLIRLNKRLHNRMKHPTDTLSGFCYIENMTDTTHHIIEHKIEIVDLVDDILCIIFSYIHSTGKLRDICLLCKKFYNIFQSNNIWQNLFYNDFKVKITLNNINEKYIYYYRIYLMIKKFMLNHHILDKIKVFKLIFVPALDFNISLSFYVFYGNKEVLVKKKQQNEIDFNIILCNLVYDFECPCPFCKDKKREPIGTIYSIKVSKPNNPNFGRICYICDNVNHGFIEFQDGQPSYKVYHSLLYLDGEEDNDDYDNEDTDDNDNISIIGKFLGRKVF
jgi:hypothetical protein